MEILTARTLISPQDFDAALVRCEALGLHILRVYGPIDAPMGVVYAIGGGALELSRSGTTPPAGLRLWLQVPTLLAAISELQARKYPGHIGPIVHQPWGLLECTVELFDGVDVLLIEVPEDHPLRWRG